MVLHGYDFRFIHSFSFAEFWCRLQHPTPAAHRSKRPGVRMSWRDLWNKCFERWQQKPQCKQLPPNCYSHQNTIYLRGIDWIYLDGWRFFFFSPRHRTCWIRPHLQHHLSVATHASHVAIPHVSYEDCGSLAMRKGEGSDLVSWCIVKKYQVIGQNMLFLPMFFMFFSFVHHLHRSSPSFLLAPSYILLYPIFVQGSIQLAVVDWFQVHPISLLGLEHLRATRSKQNQHRGSWKMSKARVISTNCWNW